MSYTGLPDNDQNGRTGGLLLANILCAYCILCDNYRLSLVACRRHVTMQVP
jgi:hypothetical protein